MKKIVIRALVVCVGLVLSAPIASAEDVKVVVRQKSKAFVPGVIHVKVGQKVSFTNEDSVAHNMFSRTEGFKFNLKMQKPGELKEIQFKQAGDAVVRCAIHPGMKLSVKVEK